MNGVVTGIERYGLQRNPYRGKPIDPLRTQQQLSGPIGVAGGLSEVEAYIERAAAHGETAFVLVQGKSGTGRTSVCNHLFRHHCAARGIDPSKLAVPKPKTVSQDSFEICRRWIIALYKELRRLGLTPLGQEYPELEQQLATSAHLTQGLYAVQATESMANLAEVLDAKSAGIGACFENVKDFDLISAAFDVFAEARALVLFTVLDYPRTRDGISVLFEGHNPDAEAVEGGHYPILSLETIRGVAARDLVQFHWRSARPGVESPFDDDALVEVFDDHSRPAARIVLVTKEVLESHVATLGPGPVWPQAREQLAFESDRLKELVPRIDKVLPVGFDD